MKTLKISLLFLVCLATLLACKKQPMEEIFLVDYERAFSPVEVINADINFDKTNLRWRSIDKANKYIIEVAEDSLPFNEEKIISSGEVEVLSDDAANGASFYLDSLFGEKRYTARVKALGFQNGQEDSKWTYFTWQTPPEQIFAAIKNIYVKGTSLTAFYTVPDGEVTHIEINPGNQIIDVSDVTIGETQTIQLDNLESNTEYTISIWNSAENRKRGELKPVTKKLAKDFENVVILAPGESLATACSNADNIGKTIYLPDGYTFNATTNPGIIFAGTMTVYGDPDAAIKPSITYQATGSPRLFTWVNECKIDELRLENLSIKHTDKTVEACVFFNASAAGNDDIDSLNSIVLENCDVANFGRSFLRLQGSATDYWNAPIGLVSLNNCTFTDCSTASYAFFTMNVLKEAVTKIEISNSTFYNIQNRFLNAQRTAEAEAAEDPCKSITIENSTFNAFGAKNYFIDAVRNASLAITLRNLIFGQSGADASGYQYAEGSSISTQNCYFTTDFVNINGKFPDLIAYPKASTDLFTDPSTGNFQIKATDFEGRKTAGDPRWR